MLRVFESGPTCELLGSVAIYCRRHTDNATKEHASRVRNHLRAYPQIDAAPTGGPIAQPRAGYFRAEKPARVANDVNRGHNGSRLGWVCGGRGCG